MLHFDSDYMEGAHPEILRRLAEEGAINGKLFVEFTSNDFLRRTGNATGVEAEIGRTFKAGGLEAAYAWIEHHLRPRMEERWHTLRRKVLR